MNTINYQKELDKLVLQILDENRRPKLLLHSCCAPCSSYCLEYLAEYFDIVDFYYNPNIAPKDEHDKRAFELKRLIERMSADNGAVIEFIEGRYEPEKFYEICKGLENVREGGERCFKCYRLRMEEAAKLAAEIGADYFTTTLSISPLKNAAKINEIGRELAGIYGVEHLPSDFKKKNGYKRSVELSAQYNLYRQNYCGCIYSKADSQNR